MSRLTISTEWAGPLNSSIHEIQNEIMETGIKIINSFKDSIKDFKCLYSLSDLDYFFENYTHKPPEIKTTSNFSSNLVEDIKFSTTQTEKTNIYLIDMLNSYLDRQLYENSKENEIYLNEDSQNETTLIPAQKRHYEARSELPKGLCGQDFYSFPYHLLVPIVKSKPFKYINS